MDSLNPMDEPCRASPFPDALHDNLELLTDLLEVIGAECAQVDERAAGLFFEGIATVIEAFALSYLSRGGASGFVVGGGRHHANALRFEAISGG